MILKGIKIFKSPPNMSDTLNHDAPVLRIMQLGLWCFIIISSITVFFGVHSYVSDYLNQQPWIMRKLGYVGAYLVLSIIPDLLCSIFFAHVVRSLLKRKYKDVLSIILNVALILIVLFLGRYSWRMSRSAATSAAYDMVPQVELKDVTKLDSLANGERQLLRKQYEDDVTAINQRYNTRLEAALSPLRQKALPYRKQIESLEASRSRNNTNWIDKQLTAINKQLLPITEEISAVTASNERRRSGELSQLKRKYQDDIAFLNNRLYENRESIQQRNGKIEQRVESLAAAFSGEFRKIAGWSIVIVLLLTALLEILYHRNGIERNPVFTQWNFRLSGLFEVMYLPFSIVGRHTLNTVRRQYAKLPALEPAPAFKEAITASNKSVKPAVTASNSDLQAVTTPVNDVSQLDTAINNYDGFFCEKNEAMNIPREEKTVPVTTGNGVIQQQGRESNPNGELNGHHEGHAFRGTALLSDSSPLATESNEPLASESDSLFITCALPDCEEKFPKKRKDHKYCCKQHRMKHWEILNGKKLKINTLK